MAITIIAGVKSTIAVVLSKKRITSFNVSLTNPPSFRVAAASKRLGQNSLSSSPFAKPPLLFCSAGLPQLRLGTACYCWLGAAYYFVYFTQLRQKVSTSGEIIVRVLGRVLR